MNTIAMIFSFFLAFIRICIGVQLIRFAYQRKLQNLIWLGLYFIIIVVMDITSTSALITNEVFRSMAMISLAVAYIPLAIFIWQTFYKGKPVVPSIITSIVGSLALSGVTFSLLAISGDPNVRITSYIFSGLVPVVVWFWHGWAAFNAYTEMRKDRTIEDWVKWRYQSMIVYSLFGLLGCMLGMMASTPRMMAISTILLTANGVIVIVLQVLVWMMPDRFRRYINRNYKAPEISISASEEAVLRMAGGK